jgi:hypothetical protein
MDIEEHRAGLPGWPVSLEAGPGGAIGNSGPTEPTSLRDAWRGRRMNPVQPVGDDLLRPGQAVAGDTSPVPSPQRRAFISAPASVDSRVIRRALESRGVVPYEIDDSAEAGARCAHAEAILMAPTQ